MEMRKIVAIILLVVSGITGIVSGILIAYNKLMYEISILRAEFENYKRGMGVLIDTNINERLEWCHDNIEEHYKILDGIKRRLDHKGKETKYCKSFKEKNIIDYDMFLLDQYGDLEFLDVGHDHYMCYNRHKKSIEKEGDYNECVTYFKEYVDNDLHENDKVKP